MKQYKRIFNESHSTANMTMESIKESVDEFVKTQLYENDVIMAFEFAIQALIDNSAFEDLASLGNDGATVDEISVNNNMSKVKKFAYGALDALHALHANAEDLQFALKEATAIDPGI